MTSRLWLLTFAMLVGCKDQPREPAPTAKVAAAPAGPSATAPTETVAAPEPPAAAPPAAQPIKGAGPVYLGVSGTGLVRIEGGKAKTLIEHKYPINDIVVDHRGVVYAAAIGGAWSIAGDKVTELPKIRHVDDHKHLAVAPNGDLWTLDGDGAHRWDRTKWEAMPNTIFKDALLSDITVDRAGRVWVATTHDLWRYDGTAWIKLDHRFTGTKEPYFDTVVAGPTGEVYVSCIRGVFVSEGEIWRKLKVGGGLSIDEIAVGADGRIAASGSVMDVAIGTSSELRAVPIKKAGAKVRQADVMAVDGSGRTWLRTDNGVVILDGDGKLVQQWAPGTVAGLTGKVEAIAVAGNGPSLPKLTAAARGTVTGKVVSRGKPVAGAAIEICTSPASLMLIEKTPCTGSAVSFTGVTAADGTFKIADVPVGSYGFAVKPKRTWFVSTWGLEECCTSLENGQVYDIGSINLEKLD
jgi:hypothetical protein